MSPRVLLFGGLLALASPDPTALGGEPQPAREQAEGRAEAPPSGVVSPTRRPKAAVRREGAPEPSPGAGGLFGVVSALALVFGAALLATLRVTFGR